MAKNIKTNSGAKLGAGYKATLWVTGIVLFLAFAFATFCAFGGLDIISPVKQGDQNAYYMQVGEDGEVYYVDADGNRISNSDLPNVSGLLSGTDLTSDSDATAE